MIPLISHAGTFEKRLCIHRGKVCHPLERDIHSCSFGSCGARYEWHTYACFIHGEPSDKGGRVSAIAAPTLGAMIVSNRFFCLLCGFGLLSLSWVLRFP